MKRIIPIDQIELFLFGNSIQNITHHQISYNSEFLQIYLCIIDCNFIDVCSHGYILHLPW
jgi:hypothetical protein